MDYRDHAFKNERIDLAGNTFHNCRFEHCELVYHGDRSPTFYDNHFIDSVFTLTDTAMKTIYFLSSVYHAGSGGQEVVEKIFDDIRQHAIHGSKVTTIAPHTPGGTLATPE
jgi:hypothetical protein